MFAGEPRSAHKRSCEKPRAAPRPGNEKWVCFGWCFWWRWIFSPPFLVAVDFWWWIFRALLNILKSGAPNDLKNPPRKSTTCRRGPSPRPTPMAVPTARVRSPGAIAHSPARPEMNERTQRCLLAKEHTRAEKIHWANPPKPKASGESVALPRHTINNICLIKSGQGASSAS